MEIKRINCVFVYCRDMTRQRSFYEQALGLGKPVVDAKWWVEWALGDGSHFALHQAKPELILHARPEYNTVKFSIEVTDIRTVAEKLKSLGARFHYEPRLEYGFWLAEFVDPEGNVLRLYEKPVK